MRGGAEGDDRRLSFYVEENWDHNRVIDRPSNQHGVDRPASLSCHVVGSGQICAHPIRPPNPYAGDLSRCRVASLTLPGVLILSELSSSNRERLADARLPSYIPTLTYLIDIPLATMRPRKSSILVSSTAQMGHMANGPMGQGRPPTGPPGAGHPGQGPYVNGSTPPMVNGRRMTSNPVCL